MNFLVEQAGKPVHKKIIENGARAHLISSPVKSVCSEEFSAQEILRTEVLTANGTIVVKIPIA